MCNIQHLGYHKNINVTRFRIFGELATTVSFVDVLSHLFEVSCHECQRIGTVGCCWLLIDIAFFDIAFTMSNHARIQLSPNLLSLQPGALPPDVIYHQGFKDVITSGEFFKLRQPVFVEEVPDVILEFGRVLFCPAEKSTLTVQLLYCNSDKKGIRRVAAVMWSTLPPWWMATNIKVELSAKEISHEIFVFNVWVPYLAIMS